MQINAVDLIFHVAVVVGKAIDYGVYGRVDHVVQIFVGHARDVVLRSELRSGYADHAEPLVIDFYVFAQRVIRTKQGGLGRFTQHANRRSGGIFVVVEKLPADHAKAGNLLVRWFDAVHFRSVFLRRGNQFRGRETLAHGCRSNSSDALMNHAVVREREALREFADFREFLIGVGFLSLDDEVAHAELLDKCHHFLLRARTDGQHRNHRSDTENHAQHGQDRTQFVTEEVFQPEAQIREPLPKREWITEARRNDRVCRSLGGAHRGAPTGPAAAGFAEPAVFCEGSMTATSVPTFNPSMTATPSVRYLI